MKTLVEMRKVTKRFPGVVALKDISFDIQAGEVHVLLGENGAGKSTLMKILSGAYQPTEGTIVLHGREYSSLTPKDAYENGISIIYQELSVIDELSIQENLFVGKLPTKKTAGFITTVDQKVMHEKALDYCKKVGLKRDPRTMVEELCISEKQQVEIAKALAGNSEVIIMDEPTASLTMEETNHLFNIIHQLKREGKGIVYISHKMKEIKEIGDRVTVLKDGTYVGTRNVADVEVDELVSMMVGRELNLESFSNHELDIAKQPVIFEARNISRRDKRVRNVSFQLHKGEILGFSGLVGSGRTEMMNAIFGAEPRESGEVYINGRKVDITNPYSAIKNGLAMVTENRRETGFINTMDIKKNISLLPYIKTSRAQGLVGLVSEKYDKKTGEEQRNSLRIKCADIDQSILQLSGGNQQKVILGKWLAADSEIIIFDEPTKGIDIGSKSEIYALMRKLADEGKGVLVVSSELPELLAVCDTIMVFREGQIVKTFPRKEATEQSIIRVSTGELSDEVK
ncbi:sugar ABC transporter ATP-binding protein [Acetanaerobacterium elongatum]|uniref:Allose ABC transporter ATP-binding protein n=1 Tax=Acetanaerobacterium elongatum TaxID=258515 RepID=A0A1H0GZJ8_9FIRM|nr:ATP-binding cassette domain-containing protein [Acetanaerobacterium elongatum]SDO12347.1 allose ABC transporter ATP-binding protein [Acetanaerobacterium elongatum]